MKIMIASATSISGDSIFPTISTILVRWMHRRPTTRKNTAALTQEEQSGSRGCTASSNVVAAVRGMLTRGPMQSVIIAVSSMAEGLPSLLNRSEGLLPERNTASRASTASPASTTMKHRKPENHFSPVVNPRYGGKIRFPAPKNMANSANPRTIIFFLFSLLPMDLSPFTIGIVSSIAFEELLSKRGPTS